GLTFIAEDVRQWSREWPSGLAPSGGHLAYITGEDDFHALELHIYAFHTGDSRLIARLVPPELEPTAGERVSAIEAITFSQALAWSPDGSQLAFIGAMDGPSADLYLYSLNHDSITRLTSGDSQLHRLSWSPDGRYLLHFGVHSFGTGAGYAMAGAWAAAADGSGAIDLFEPAGGDEVIDGWWDARTAVIHSWDAGCGEVRLRAIDILTGEQSPLWDDYFGQVSVDPGSGSVLFAVPSRIADCNPGRQQGLFFITKGGGPVRILEDDAHRIIWSPQAQLFFARTEFGVVAVSTLGDWVQLETLTGNFPAANPSDKSLAWYGAEGLWLSPLQVTLDGPQPQKVFDEAVKFASWDPGGEYLFFITDDSAFVLRRSDLQIFLMSAEIEALQGDWLLP
ncbi:MAG: hypothetical protein OEV06_13005, partial [Anaerolineae bacterium]|nr:hypothetical protein [Anaerolineae bacterium]